SPSWASNDFNWDSTTGSIDMRIQIKVKITILKGFINGLWLVGFSKTAFYRVRNFISDRPK
ncbi:MAG: hypothetical protein ACK49P_03325, partial [Bacteroidota bacterium]